MRTTLVAALSECVDDTRRRIARRFLQGLSADELQYIAEYLGSYILESSSSFDCPGPRLVERVTRFERCHPARARCRHEGLDDREHKMILLIEFLRRCRPASSTAALPARHA